MEIQHPFNCAKIQAEFPPEEDTSMWLSLGSDAPLNTASLANAVKGEPQDGLELSLYYEEPWKMKKKLTKSDTNGSARLLLSTHLVEKWVLPSMDQNRANGCRTVEGTNVCVWDCDTGSQYDNMKLKKWITNNYVLAGKWTKDFVKSRGLEEGDEVGLLWDGSRFLFTLLNKRV